MKCPTCGGDCVRDPELVLDELFQIYLPCRSCPPDPLYDKKAPLNEKIYSDTGRCTKCGRRHLDHVVGHVLTLLKESSFFPADAILIEVGTPLIEFGFQIPYPPRLPEKSLVLIMDSITEEIAGIITAKVPEIKGVIRRKGHPSNCIGLRDTDTTPHTYELLSGCDMRCDVVSSIFGELCIYKNQSVIHIEFNNTKIKKIEALYIKGELDNAVVVDGFCGPGTLGLLCALGGAKKVILNDAWLPAVRNAILNLKANSALLGAKIEFELIDHDNLIGDEPVLMAKAGGRTEILVYHGDIRKLAVASGECDICLIDTFPSVNPAEYLLACRDFSKKTVLI
ncbi:MAG: hypothetical protein Q7J35_02015 [Candidatus Methanoperedens sp.]|nr:hypothetical protein [Candidatus Methanoperedens sp.]